MTFAPEQMPSGKSKQIAWVFGKSYLPPKLLN